MSGPGDPIEGKLDDVASLYAAHRREGHTRAIMDGVRVQVDALVVAADDQHARVLREEYPGVEIHSLGERFDKLRGRTVAVVLDNAAVAYLCAMASTRIRALLASLQRTVAENAAYRRRAEAAESVLRQAMAQNAHILDQCYIDRNLLVAALVAQAQRLGWGHGLAVDDDGDEGWRTVVLVDVPGGGQCSWHVSDEDCVTIFSDVQQYDGKWDGHTTDEKRGRLRAYLDAEMGRCDATSP